MKTLQRKVETHTSLLVLAMGAIVGATVPPARADADTGRRDDTSEAVDRSQWALRESAQAIAQVRKILGLPEAKTDGLSATLVTLEHDETPYLSDQIIGKPIWHAVVRDWALELESSPPGFKDRYTRTFDMLVDPRNGVLLTVKSRWPAGAVPVLVAQTPTRAAEQMWRSGREVYHGFPREEPKVTFLDAVDSVQRSGGNPMIARQIIGEFVMWSRMNQEPAPVWAITLRGIPPRPRHRRAGHRSVPQFQHRYIVDGETGKWLCSTNTPNPVLHDPEDGD